MRVDLPSCSWYLMFCKDYGRVRLKMEFPEPARVLNLTFPILPPNAEITEQSFDANITEPEPLWKLESKLKNNIKQAVLQEVRGKSVVFEVGPDEAIFASSLSDFLMKIGKWSSGKIKGLTREQLISMRFSEVKKAAAKALHDVIPILPLNVLRGMDYTELLVSAIDELRRLNRPKAK